MAIWHRKSKRKETGAKLTKYRKKRKHELGHRPTRTTIGKDKLKKFRVRGGGEKFKLLVTDQVNVLNKDTGKYEKSKILDVLENEANPHFVREKIITKGAVIKTEAGKAKVTSRPAQTGVVNAVLIEPSEKKKTAKPKAGKKKK